MNMDPKADWDLAAAAQASQPFRGKSLLRWVSLALVVGAAWAALTQVDEVTRGDGKVIPSRQLQVVQSVDGGVVSEILVTEGQSVKAGDILMRIDPTRFESSLRENKAQYLALKVKVERLKAISEGKDFRPSEEVASAIPQIVEQERQLFASTRSEMDAQLAIARQQLSQRHSELSEAVARRDQASRAWESSNRELAVTRPLLATGAVSEVELLRLEREVGRYRGERDQAAAQIARLQAAIAEAGRKIQEVQLTYQNQVRGALSEASARLGAVSESNAGLQDKVKYADLRAPVNGTVKRLLINTVGGVVPSGKEVIEIVPSDDTLLLEARVSPKDIGFLRPKQKATVRFSAYDFAIYGGLDAVVEHIGADTVTDDKGNPFYVIRVRTLASGFGEDLPIIVGMVAQVDVLTGKKSILSYLLKPVLRARAYALTER
jgi:adhesin transport system membrane fusion protein